MWFLIKATVARALSPQNHTALCDGLWLLLLLEKMIFWKIFYLGFSKGRFKPKIYLLNFYSLKNSK